MIILDGDIKQALIHVDPRIHRYSGKADDLLWSQYGKRLADHDNTYEDIVDIIKEIMALGIHLGDISIRYGEL